jgi:hypothetical protein
MIRPRRVRTCASARTTPLTHVQRDPHTHVKQTKRRWGQEATPSDVDRTVVAHPDADHAAVALRFQHLQN